MDNYCKHCQTIGGKFSFDTVITEITIPPSCEVRFLSFVIQTVQEYHGKIESTPWFSRDGRVLFTDITFEDDDKRNICCEKIEKAIESFLETQKSSC